MWEKEADNSVLGLYLTQQVCLIWHIDMAHRYGAEIWRRDMAHRYGANLQQTKEEEDGEGRDGL